MEAQTFPPSPNWYLSDILCTGPNGQVIYGSRNVLIILNYESNSLGSNSLPKIQTVEYAHKERITSVQFCPNAESKFGNNFVSAGDDSLVKLWDLKTMTPIIANFAHGEDKKVISMDWSPIDVNVIVSVDDQGGIVIWNIEKNTTYKLNLTKLLQMKKTSGVKVNVGKLLPSIIKCCPHEKDLIAIGMKGGVVCLISTKDPGKVLHCLRGHDKDVTSLAWCPEPGNVFEEKDDQGKALILASICKDRLIYLWGALDGHFVRTIKLPMTSLGQHSRLPAVSSLLMLNWPSKSTILSSSNYGEILRCNLSSGKISSNEAEDVSSSHPKSQWTLVHDLHPRGVFSIHSTQHKKDGKEDNAKETVIWTTAQDRNLIAFSLEEERVLMNLPTIGGFVYCMASSPFDPSRVAVGLGDFSIRIWNTGNTKAVQMSSLWQKIKGKVMAVAWHPTQEMKLAFGTHEGRVGIQDLIPGHLPTVFVLRHRHPVYSLSWGPPCFKEGEAHSFPQFCLYSCGDGEILMYNPNEAEKEPKRMVALMRGESDSKKKEGACTDIAWKPDHSLLAVGNSDGTVQIYSAPHLKLVYTLFAHRKLLMTLTWHPLSTSSDTGLSPFNHCLATGSNDKMIHVFDFSSLVKSVAAKEDFKGSVQPIATLTGHQNKIVRLAWSPHTSGQLCSASYDNTIRVWDVIHQKCYGCFMGHKGAALVCMWSPLDPDIILSGSSDFTLCSWRISEAKYIPKSANNASHKKKQVAIPSVPANKTEKCNEKVDVTPVPVAKPEGESSKSGAHTWKGSLFPVSWKIAGGIGKVDGVCQLLQRKEEAGGLGNTDEPSMAKLGFYGNREDMHRLLKKEEEHHLAQENVEQAHLLGLWRGNVAEMVKDAISQGKLTGWLVSIAPSASHKLWLEACQAYSEQLAKSGKYNQAAAYLLACHKVDEAVELLRRQALYREALAIARCRLDEEDPTIHKITMEWGQNLLMKGNYEVSAMCFASIGEYLDAARALGSRSTMPECISLAAKLALKAGEGGKELAMVLTLQCIRLHLSENKWNAALECIKPIEELMPFSIVIRLHRKLQEGYKSIDGMNEDLLCQWLTAEKKGSSEGDKVLPLLQLSSLPWTDNSIIKADDAYTCIATRRSNSEKNFMLELAEELALAVCAASSEGEDREWHHILKSMSLCYAQQLVGYKEGGSVQFSLLHLCFLLSPNGPEGLNHINDNAEAGTTKGYLQSARAFCALAVVMWSESNWSTEKGEWPWHLLISLLISYLPDVLDPSSASYYKDEVEIHKMEQELAKFKATLRLGKASVQVKNSKEKAETSRNNGEKVSGNEDKLKSNKDTVGDESHCVLENTMANGDVKENEGTESAEDILKEKESALGNLKKKREDFERSRISAPNPFVCLFKLRNICDIIGKACRDKENALPEDFQEFQDKISNVMVNSL